MVALLNWPMVFFIGILTLGSMAVAAPRVPRCEHLLTKIETQNAKKIKASHVFKVGEWVRLQTVGAESLPGSQLTNISEYGVRTPDKTLLAKVVEITEEHVLLKLYMSGMFGFSSYRVYVYPQFISALPTASSVEAVDEVLRIFSNLPVKVALDDYVGIRDINNGWLYGGKVVRITPASAGEKFRRVTVEIEGLEQKEFEVAEGTVSRLSGRFYPSNFTHSLTSLPAIRIEKRVAQFFDAARKVTSQSEFFKKSFLEKLEFVARFANLFFVKDHKLAYPFACVNPDQMLGTGGAVCHQKAYYVGTILTEAGFLAEIQFHNGDQDHPGHAWVVARECKECEGYIVDLGKPEEILTEERAKALAAADPTSLAAIYYAASMRGAIHSVTHR